MLPTALVQNVNALLEPSTSLQLVLVLQAPTVLKALMNLNHVKEVLMATPQNWKLQANAATAQKVTTVETLD